MLKRLRVFLLVAVALLSTAALQAQAANHWVAAWATAQDMAPTVQEMPEVPPGIQMPDFSKFKGKMPQFNIPKDVQNQTIRMVVRTSLGGSKLRIELANAFGKTPVLIGNAHVALRTKDSAIDPSSDRSVTFSDSASVVLRPGTVIVSDPIALDVKANSDLAVSLYVAKSEGVPTSHMLGLHTAYLASGDTTSAASMPSSTTTTSYLWLRSVDVEASANDYAIACLGDSITDGFGTTVDANKAWPTLLAERLAQRSKGARVAVLNQGISGNQVLRDGAGVSALARLDRDVLTEPGVRWIVLLEGINDINTHGLIVKPGALTAEDLIQGYRQIIARAHLSHIKVMGATLTPEEGVWLAGPVGEATRLKVNQWIRTGGEFDAIVDFDQVVRDPAHPARIREEFNPGDHIHPNDLGNKAMADAFQLAVFED
jgi:lysophospholipase L1-like esterase